MAGFCWSPGFLQENENPRKLIDDLKLIVQKFNMPQIREMITQIENGENSIDKLSPQHSEFGDRLIKHLSENCGENHASKACFVNRLKKETQKVIKDVLDGEDNMRWLAGCLSVVAYIMEQENEPGNDARQFRHSLLYMFSLLKHIKQTTAWDVTPQMLNDVAQFIVLGCLLFHIQLHQPNLQWCGSILNETDTTNLEFRLGSTYKKLAFGSIMKNIPTSLYSSQTRRTSEVAINKARDGVIELLRVTSDDESRRAVVIEGTDGIGKTTVANAAIKFLDLRCYKVTRLDIDDYVSEPDIKILQQRFLRDLFGKCIHLKNCVDGRARLSNAFREEACWPVFMFIDNAHFQFDIAKLLPAEGEWLPVKSRILITTPDRSLCTLPAYLTPFHFQMNPLADSDAKDLISQNVTGSGEAIDSLMTKCRGIPLALVMLSSYLRQLGGKVAPNAFESIIPSPTEADICSSIVHFIYSSLEEKEKEAFLDIAIFFNNWERRLVSQIFCDIQLNVLEEKGLLMISREGKLRINAAVRKHATHISGKDRITDVESFKDALQDKEKLSKIKGIWHSEGDSELQLQAEDLDVMHTSLRVLYLGRSTKVNGECRNNFGDLRFLYLYQEDCLPLSLRNLASVNFYRSRLQNNGDFYELNRSVDDLKLRGISKLPTLVRELQLTRSLHVLDLSDSPNMQKLPQGFKCFSSLKVLDLNKCFRLTCLPESISELESLYRLNLRGCSELKELPETLGDLSCLAELDCTENHKLDVVPDSFSKLKSLRHLQFRGCSQLAYLPKSFGNLSSLEYLDLSHCTELSVLPNSFQKLTSLSLFRIADSSLIQLPENFGNLSSLKELDLSENKK